jgi:rhodanese-related sulfurtransferase
MAIKSAQQLVQEAYTEVKTINTTEALTLVKDNKCNLIDIRDVRELEKEGRVENSSSYSKRHVRILDRSK